MSSPLIQIGAARRFGPMYGLGAAVLTSMVLGWLLAAGCDARRGEPGVREAARTYPPLPQTPRVVALGTLRGAEPPSDVAIELSLFLFGVEPPPPLLIANPTAVAAVPDGLLICDGALRSVFRWDAASDQVSEERFEAWLDRPLAIDVAANGDRLICNGRRVVRVEPSGAVGREYVLDSGEFKPGGVLALEDQVWVTNLAAHRIEVFDAATGRHVRSIGRRGRAAGQFGLPRGLARTPEGQICVVDTLNNRVQVLDPEGNWVRDIGRPGDRTGCFGRPKDVAVGPDGTVFVTDVFSQRVHAFAPDGRPLLAFGEPASGRGALALPSGVAVTTVRPRTETALTPRTTPAYYVLVAEQLRDPGVRVYAWLGVEGGAATGPLPSGNATDWKPRFPNSAAINPHWHAARCTTCHKEDDGRLSPIPRDAVDRLCLSCHDGVQAFAEPHPIGRPARTELVTTPADWPTVGDVIGCLTCHNIKRHCSADARRPAINSILLRGYDVQRSLEYCGSCHPADQVGRFSPHRQRDATGRIREDACFFCHTQRPQIPADGRRRFAPALRDESSDLCLRCHSRHWDLSPGGHVDRPLTAKIRQWMLIREMSLEMDADLSTLARIAAASQREPARLPLGGNRVTCYTCHNPHYAGLFPPDSELDVLADDPADRASALRANWIDLCSECHNR